MNPKVSILVPVFGVERFIERCAVSLFEQSFESIEFIFVNDCTKDNSIVILQKVIDKYPSRKSNISIISNKKNYGIGVVRNILVDNAKGDYVLFVDSDDYIEQNTVEELYMQAICSNSEIVTCDILVKWENTQEIMEQAMGANKEEFIQNLLSAKTILGLVNKLIDIRLFRDNNIFIPSGINYGEDYMIMPKLSYFAQKISKVQLPLYNYLQLNPNSYTTKKLSKKNIDNIIFVLNDLTEFFISKKDCFIYREALLQGKLRKKMNLLFFADKKYLKDLILLFPETNGLVSYSFLINRDKFGYVLVRRKLVFFFIIYREAYRVLFNIKKLFTNRN